jgi:hypothetical protein
MEQHENRNETLPIQPPTGNGQAPNEQPETWRSRRDRSQIERVIRIEEHETVICSVKNIKNQIGIGLVGDMKNQVRSSA